MSCPRIIIAGTQSGTGKTSLTIALIAALRRRGLRVQAFKVGPDFLDPSYLALASERPCYNLDGWMMGRDYVCRLFARASAGADICVIEGVMGLFDGAGAVTVGGSTAEIAAWLEAPVLLAVNVHGMAGSIAALVDGYAGFDREVKIVGVVANHCGSERHASWLADSLRFRSLPPLVGYVERGALPGLSSRHLGLVTADRRNLSASKLERLADVFERHVPVGRLFELAKSAPPMAFTDSKGESPRTDARVGVAWDTAFHFYYPDLFDELSTRGADIVYFSPIADDCLPADLNALYFGGGYPEEHAESLSANRGMVESIRRFARSGRPVYAECGGLMYLSQGIVTREGKAFPMVGLLPQWTRMLDRKKTLGYAEVTLTEDSLWGKRGTVLKGHEFHYSELAGEPGEDAGWVRAYAVKKRRSGAFTREGFQRGRVLASYVHLHPASRPEAVDRFLLCCGEDHGG